jgi:hypothetical protein
MANKCDCNKNFWLYGIQILGLDTNPSWPTCTCLCTCMYTCTCNIMICVILTCMCYFPDEEKPGSAKKRRKSASGTPLSRVGSPGTTPFKPAMTERQQMALLLQLTDPNKQHASKWRMHHVAGNIRGRNLSRISGKWTFRGENFHGWLSNREICESFPLESFLVYSIVLQTSTFMATQVKYIVHVYIHVHAHVYCHHWYLNTCGKVCMDIHSQLLQSGINTGLSVADSSG